MPEIRNTQYETCIYILLALYILVSSLYAIIVPPFEASDELWHYPMVKTIADNWALPVQDPQNIGPWRQEGSQPPLYYFIGAVATFWIDTSDVDVVRHLNPHADAGSATPDGNINLVTHNPEAEAFPWKGTTLAVRLIRLLSVLMSTATVYLTYRLALELGELANQRISDEWQRLALVAAAVNAFTPMFAFIGGAINNDNLIVPLCSLALLLMVRIVKATDDGRRTTDDTSRITFYVLRFTQLGLVIGLGLLTKGSAAGLIPLVALTAAYVAWRERSFRTFLIGGVATGAPTLLISGWWYVRNWRIYGDVTGNNVFFEILGTRDVPADLAQLWRERVSLVRGYWGNFGGLNVPMPEWVYVAFDVLLLLAALGLILTLLTRIRPKTLANLQTRKLTPWRITLLWPLIVVILWIIWATNTWSSQGRLFFSAISVWSLLLALGWHHLANWLLENLRSSASICVPFFMFLISLIAPLAWIRPAYARPPALTDAQVAAIPQRVDTVFFHPAGGQIKLLGYDAPIEATYPGETVPITLYWEAIEPFNLDYSVFLHLVDEHDLISAQRDAYPGMGTLSTRQIKPGQRWSEERMLTLPESAFSPNQTIFEVGLYDFVSKERLTAVDAGGQIAGNNIRFGKVNVVARPGGWPNSISADFGGEMELVGYDLDRRALRPGETATLTLYWRGQRRMDTNYAISTQFVGEHAVKAAQMDAWPLEGALPTTAWEPGQLIEEARSLEIFEGTPPGVYDVYIAVYPSGNPGPLLVVTPPGGRLQTDHVVLTTIRVLP